MRAEDIIECFNLHIEDKRKELGINSSGHIVLQKTTTPHNIFKAYKVYKYIIWYINNSKKIPIHTIQITEKVIGGHEEYILRRMNMETLRTILNLVGTEIYNKIIQGTYETA